MQEALIALGGVALGGVIAAATSAYFSWQSERDHRLAVARSLFFKFFLMTDVVNRVSRDLDAASPDGNGLHWPRLRPLAGVRFPDGSFSPDELTLLGSEKGPHFGQRVLVAANAMHLLADLLFQYNAERRALSEEFRMRGLDSVPINGIHSGFEC